MLQLCGLLQEKDLHSGLIGPLIICKPQTLDSKLHLQANTQEYALLFHSFDETKSWYMEENLQRHCAPPCQAIPEDPWFQISNKFAGRSSAKLYNSHGTAGFSWD